jgi:alkylation response protein AidB-like acyl-CoA dehydrogenase
MDFRFSPEELALRDAVHRFAQERLAPAAAGVDESAEFPWEGVRGLADLGVLGLNLPEAHGGTGASPLALALAMEEMTAGCAATASAVGAHYLATDAIHLGGDDTLKSRYLPRAARGEILGAYALTEPQSGSDPGAMRTRAWLERDAYRIEGVKHFITNGQEADFVVVFARTEPEAGHRGISALVVERDTPGFTITRHEEIMGIRGSRIYELAFDCRVSASQLVGASGSGFKIAMAVLDRGRIETAAMGLGLARNAFDAAVVWAKQRKGFGNPIAKFQGIQWMLADMATSLKAARLLTYRAAWSRGQGDRRFTQEAAMAKLFASEMAAKVTDLALQIHGGYGYTRSMPLERYVRDARILRIFEGTSEIQRNVIARSLLA